MKDPKIIEARKMLCRYLGDLAKENGITTYEIARLTGFEQPNVHRMLSGKYSPTLDGFIKLCDAMKCYIFIIDKDAEGDLVNMMKKRWRRPADEQ
jgi:transcriptional regulator with XRE-family HTH domain